MTPAEAARLLGLPENATEAQITEAYAARVATVPDSDVAAVDAFARARDALLAGVRWLPPQSAGAARQWEGPQAGTTPSAAQQAHQQPTTYPPRSAQPPQANVAATAPGIGPLPGSAPFPGGAPVPGPGGASVPGNGPFPAGAPFPGGAPVPGPGAASYPQQSPYLGYPQPSAYPITPSQPRKPLSNGAIIGIALGSTALLLVVLLVAVIALAGNARHGAAGTAAQHGSAAAPSAPPSSGDPSAADQSYVIDGVTIQPQQGWTFLLTSSRDCPGAEVIVGFSDTVDGDSIDQHTDTVSLKAGVPYTYTVPDTASTHQYAGIDDLQCIPT